MSHVTDKDSQVGILMKLVQNLQNKIQEMEDEGRSRTASKVSVPSTLKPASAPAPATKRAAKNESTANRKEAEEAEEDEEQEEEEEEEEEEEGQDQEEGKMEKEEAHEASEEKEDNREQEALEDGVAEEEEEEEDPDNNTIRWAEAEDCDGWDEEWQEDWDDEEAKPCKPTSLKPEKPLKDRLQEKRALAEGLKGTASNDPPTSAALTVNSKNYKKEHSKLETRNLN